MSTLLIFILHCRFFKISRLSLLFLGPLQNISCATNVREILLYKHGNFPSLVFIYQGDWERSRESITDGPSFL